MKGDIATESRYWGSVVRASARLAWYICIPWEDVWIPLLQRSDGSSCYASNPKFPMTVASAGVGPSAQRSPMAA